MLTKDTIIFDFYNTLYNPIKCRLFMGTLDLLDRLDKNYNLVLITTGQKKRINLIRNLQLYYRFSQIVVCRKKTVEIFKNLISPNSKTIIIGDRIEEEIRIAKKTGCEYLLVNPKKENPITTIRNYLL